MILDKIDKTHLSMSAIWFKKKTIYIFINQQTSQREKRSANMIYLTLKRNGRNNKA